jgi:8-oxo-dGTP pyrophosphatase MutT (NUDIX family)
MTSVQTSWPFDDTTRRNIAARCTAFARLPENQPAPALKRAAVAIALTKATVDAGGTALLLTLRAPGLRAHRSQWALPGGRCDEGETPVEAALRELHEELGLEPGHENVLGLLDDYPTRSGYLITPVVVWAAAGGAISPNPQEVASVHHIALDQIERTDAFDFVAIPESPRRVIRFRHAGRFIHAPTAALIYQFREVMAGRDTRVAELEQPVFAWK